MWFEILPCVGIMVSVMSLGMLGSQLVPWLGLNGHRQYKDLIDINNITMYHRDERLGNMNCKAPYWQKGLDTVADEPPTSN